jgi:peptidoglycan/xylan/chitin deacetylase (PgdA/CDA1 family)
VGPAVATAAAANPGAVAPIRVHASSLRQVGPRLVWHVDTEDPFSANELARDRRSLCLLIERVSEATVVGQVCVKHPGDRRRPKLVYRRVTRSGGVGGEVIEAAVSRTNAQDLTASFLPASVGVDYRPLRWQVLSTARPPACIPASPDPLGCTARFPAAPALARLYAPQPTRCGVRGPAYVTNGARARRLVALTFDDGPWPDTPQFLGVLERAHVPATFFMIGEQVAGHDALLRRMLADGDMIGNHTWSHPNVAGAGANAASQISRTAVAIRQTSGGFTPCLFRAPYGAVSGTLISEVRGMGLTTIQWDVDPTDWARPGTDAIYQRVVGAVQSGSIVIQHDGGGNRAQTLAALPREIDTLKARGYKFVTVTDLLGLQLSYR